MTFQAVNQWADETKRNPYPFTDLATLRDSTGGIVLQRPWILDAKLWPVISGPTRVYLKSIERSQGYLKFTISSLDEDLMSAETTDLTKRRLALYDVAGIQSGYLQFAPGGLAAIHDHPSQVYRFPVGATEFCAAAVAPRMANGLSSARDDQGGRVDSDIRIVGGEGVELVPTASGFEVNVIGDAFYRRDTCDRPEELGLLINPVRVLPWRDIKTGTQGIIRPLAGRVVTRIVSTAPRGFASPGDNGEILSMLGA